MAVVSPNASPSGSQAFHQALERLDVIQEQAVIDHMLIVGGQLGQGIVIRYELESSGDGSVIVDDFAGTGKTIADGLESFLEPISAQLQITGTPVLVVLLYATAEAQERLAKLSTKLSSLRIEVYVGVELGPEARAFRPDHPGIW